MINLLASNTTSADTTLIWNITSISISAILSILTIINTIILTKGDRKQQAYRDIIAKQRLKDYNDIRAFLSEFLQEANILITTKNHINFDKSYCNLICQFKPQYAEDFEILSLLNCINVELHNYIENKMADDLDSLYEKLEYVRRKILAYCYANWQCIKEELGKTKMQHKNTSQIYNKIFTSIQQNYENKK